MHEQPALSCGGVRDGPAALRAALLAWQAASGGCDYPGPEHHAPLRGGGGAAATGRQSVTLCARVQELRALASMRAARGVLLLHEDGSATALLPKPLAAQVAAVTQRKHYRAALGVARDELARLPPESSEATAARDMIARTSAKYAAHLLERACEPEAAMQQYLQTIGCACTRPLRLQANMPLDNQHST